MMPDPSEGGGSTRSVEEREIKIYDELCNNIRVSDDISFKLLGLVPLISGSGAAILTLKGITHQAAAATIAISGIAAAITFGLFKWELRNVQKCEWLIRCAAAVEEKWFADLTSGSSPKLIRQFSGWSSLPRPSLFGGIPAFESATGKTTRRWFEVGKSQAEQIIYWASIAAWLIPIMSALLDRR